MMPSLSPWQTINKRHTSQECYVQAGGTISFFFTCTFGALSSFQAWPVYGIMHLHTGIWGLEALHWPVAFYCTSHLLCFLVARRSRQFSHHLE
jgi:hypothetical protein